MNRNQRQLSVAIGAIFGAGFIHSLLPPGDIWLRAAMTGGAAMVTSLLLAYLLPRSPKV